MTMIFAESTQKPARGVAIGAGFVKLQAAARYAGCCQAATTMVKHLVKQRQSD
jgi:hypothetical protein